jgi:pimeloyl-ACP methyl ester carboxylesterase
LDYSELISGLASSSGLYSSFTWSTLGELLQAAYVKDAPRAARAIADLTGILPPGFENYTSVSAAIACADTDNPRNPNQYRRVGDHRDRTVAPYFGSRWANFGLVCASWQGRSTERHTGPWTARTVRPVLLINTRYDPATPYKNAVRVRRLLPNSVLLTVDGVGHGGLALSSCAYEVTARYLLTGTTPAPGMVCRQDFQPFDPIPTAKTTQTRLARASLPTKLPWPHAGG